MRTYDGAGRYGTGGTPGGGDARRNRWMRKEERTCQPGVVVARQVARAETHEDALQDIRPTRERERERIGLGLVGPRQGQLPGPRRRATPQPAASSIQGNDAGSVSPSVPPIQRAGPAALACAPRTAITRLVAWLRTRCQVCPCA